MDLMTRGPILSWAEQPGQWSRWTHGVTLKVIRGPVPSALTQNAVTAEWMAAAVAIQYLAEGELHIDCSAVVGGLQEWLAGCPQLAKAALWFFGFRQRPGSNTCSSPQGEGSQIQGCCPVS